MKTEEYQKITNEEADTIVALCEKESENHWSQEYELYRRSKDFCPNCESQRLVDKINRIKGEGHGSVSGSLFGFSGSYDSSVDTEPTRHCNDCGNEWIPYDPSSKSARKILESYLHDFSWFLRDYNLSNEDKKSFLTKFYPDSVKKAMDKLIMSTLSYPMSDFYENEDEEIFIEYGFKEKPYLEDDTVLKRIVSKIW